MLTVVDQWSRWSPIVDPEFSLRGRDVAAAVDAAIAVHAKPVSVTVDHGTEFPSRPLEDWAYSRGVALDFTRPGTGTSNRSTGACATSVSTCINSQIAPMTATSRMIRSTSRIRAD